MKKLTGSRMTRWFSIIMVIAVVIVPFAATSPAAADPPPPMPTPSDDLELAEPIQMLLPDRAALNYLSTNDWDLGEDARQTEDGVLVTVVVTPSQLAFLKKLGYIEVGKDWKSQKAVPGAPVTAQAAAAAATDTVIIMRADYWTSTQSTRLSIEAKSDQGSTATLTATWEPAPIFGITCAQAVGLGFVPENTTFQYSLRLTDPGTNSGSGKVTNRVWQGLIQGPAAFDAVIDWPITPSEGTTDQDSQYSWEISVPGGLVISKGQGFFDCSAPLPTVPPSASVTLSRFTDAGVYMYHRRVVSLDGRPGRIVVTSSLGGSAETYSTEWLPDAGQTKPYETDFIASYMDPTALTTRIEALAAEFPDLAEIVNLPNKTNGYRRQAMGMLAGATTSGRVVITSQAWGYQGGNGITVEVLDPGAPDQPLSVSVSGNVVTINLATDSGGATTSTAGQVIDAINTDLAASALIRADDYRNQSSSGLVLPQSIVLTDYLNAPPEVSREPWQVKALRIGVHRDGSKVGVLMYAQEHAREWQTPLVVLETAERLLRNYGNGGPAKNLLDNLDIFVVPTVNPDGANYSFYDYNMQRKNMTNYCLGENSNDPNSRNSWGVDINRNYDIGSYFDGYSGGSGSCNSTTFSGPAELSEPESRNIVWLADTFTNIKFAMNVHSSGNYFMWAPGAYIVPGRITLQPPTLGQENYFWMVSAQILQAIKSYRGLVVTPGQTGQVVDVLYSAAGNSGDRLWYGNHIYAWDFEVGTSFQPAWDEAHSEAMEFASGLIALAQVALNYEKDNHIPNATLVDAAGSPVLNQKFTGEVYLHFETSEPATVYYTLDGSRPTFGSLVYNASGVREPGQILKISSDTTVNWFSVDADGNISRNYDPNKPNSNAYDSATVRFR